MGLFIPAPRGNFSATVDPTTTDDASLGYTAGSGWLNTTTHVMWRCASATVGAAVWVAMQPIDHPGYISGKVYETFEGTINTTNAIGAADTLYLYPYYVRAKVSIQALTIRVPTGGASSHLKAAVFGSKNGLPFGAALLANNTGAVSTASPTNISLAVSGTLTPRIIWLASICDGTPPTCKSVGAAGTSHLMGRTNYQTSTNITGLSCTTVGGSAITFASDISAISFNGAETLTELFGGAGIPMVGLQIA